MCSKKSNYTYWFIIILLISVALTIIYFIEKSIYVLISLIINYHYPIVSIMIFLHLWLIKSLVRQFIFPGSSYLIQKLISYRIGSANAKDISNLLLNFKNSLNLLINTEKFDKNNLARYVKIFKKTRDTLGRFVLDSNKIASSEDISIYHEQIAYDFHQIITLIEQSNVYNELKNAVTNYDPESTQTISKLNPVFERLKEFCSNAEEKVQAYLSKNNPIQMTKNFFSNDSFCSRAKFKLDLMNRYHHEEIKIITDNEKYSIDALLLKPYNYQELTQNKLMILCGPNGNPFEFNNFYWPDFYTDQNLHLLLWNYRGFGLSSGTPSFNDNRKDAITVLNYMKRNYKWSKIAVHGISIGNLSACSLASKNLVDFCFADRAFSSIDDIILDYPFGKYLRFLYKLLLFRESDNVQNFIQSDSFKVLSCDPTDNLITDGASLKSGISRKILPEILKNFDTEITNQNTILKQILQKDYFDFVESVIYFIDSMKDKKKSKSKEKGDKYKYNKLRNLNEDPKENEEYKTLIKIKAYLEEFDSVGQSLNDINNYNSKRKEEFLNDYFSNLFVWGSHKGENLIFQRKNAYLLAKVKLTNLTGKLSKIISGATFNTLNEIQNKYLSKLNNGLIKITQEYTKIIFGKNSVNMDTSISYDGNETMVSEAENYSGDKISENIENLKIGNIIALDCGHNGFFSKEEITIYQRYLIDANIII